MNNGDKVKFFVYTECLPPSSEFDPAIPQQLGERSTTEVTGNSPLPDNYDFSIIMYISCDSLIVTKYDSF